MMTPKKQNTIEKINIKETSPKNIIDSLMLKSTNYEEAENDDESEEELEIMNS